jgi:uncharacterized protein
MRDLFDDFLEELRRREAAARGEDPDAGAPKRARPVGPDDGDDDVPREPAPPRRSAGRAGRSPRRRNRLWLVVVAVIALFVVFNIGLDIWTDALWYASVRFDGVFWTRLGAQGVLFFVTLIAVLAILLGNLRLAGRLLPPADDGRPGGSFRSWFDRLSEAATGANPDRFGGSGRWPQDRPPRQASVSEELPDLTPIASVILLAISVLIALAIAGSVAASWETILLWQHRVPFSPDAGTIVADPIFGRDIGFFLFDLPFLRFLQALFNGVVIATAILVLARYLVAGTRGTLVFTTRVRAHLAVLGALFLLSVAVGYQLDKFELAYSTRGIATGVSYTDQHAQFLAFDVLAILSAVAAVVLLATVMTRRLLPLGVTIGVWLIASLVIGRLYPEAIQRFTVQPNQFAQEQPYIANNIAMTRLAFGLDRWQDRPFKGEAVLTQAMIDSEADTFRNARLWDYRPLGVTLDQLQTVRRYYAFTDVDTDRYLINGVQRQVMLSGRELALDRNPPATGWVNERVIYTHGVGVAMVPVNEVANEGQPRTFIGNLPPVSVAGAPTITQPRIYFGERPSSYIVVGAKQREFDYPTGEGDQTGSIGTETNWSGTTGIKLDSPLTRLLFGLRFRDLDLLISDQVTPASQLLFHRTLSDRVQRVAPFLRYDKDPYLVIDGSGRLVYIQDAYTVSDRFPHAQSFDTSTLEGNTLGAPINYLRNSVKITMDAYDGTMHFYVSDPTDPLIRAYAGIFPSLFEPIAQLPADLRAHLRVPEEQFNIQTRMFGRYHVTDPAQFFRSDDVWTVPQGQTSEQTLPSEAYYVVMRMPGEPHAEFLLLQPMVPTGRPNMIAWIAARMDDPNYGVTRVYRFPADTTIFGPAQIEARIDQNPLISQQITLWSTAGSTVIRGNLIVVPVGDSLIYLQPVYLQSTGSAFPEFRRIVVASPREVVWAETLGEALRLLLAAENGAAPGPGATPTPEPGPSATPGPTATPGPEGPLPSDVAGLIAYANTHFERAQAALRAGDFATYGAEIAKVEAALKRLDELAPGLGIPSPGTSVSPAP